MSEAILNIINDVDREIKEITVKKLKLEHQLEKLKSKRKELQATYNTKLRNELDHWTTWSDASYPWSCNVDTILKDKFSLSSFRPQQLAAINATLSKKDVILLMPTGGGKSLCYQLPALINAGITLVISPLLSLIEDQIFKLRALNINAVKVTSGESNDVKKAVYDYMNKKVGKPIKLIYVTPEWLAKSKRFMSALQKCNERGMFDRIAIDEVHCCSQWGHDFRLDYKYLALLKGMFPTVPILGLTATATTKVLQDIQEMIDIPVATVIKAPFDRPNLNFKVIAKPETVESCLNYLAKLLNEDFKSESGIIYTTTIKESEQLAAGLRNKGLQVRQYHAELDKERRTVIHKKWINNEYQVVVATVAFGMGIDKPDVRFVIHHSMPKSMEALYQESGRAGRDGKKAQCIVLYKLGDYFRHYGMANSKTTMENVNAILEYCLNYEVCRHDLIGQHFEENTNLKCRTMCDNCSNSQQLLNCNATKALTEIYTVMEKAREKEINLTLIKLIEMWMKTFKPSISKEEAEQIIGKLLLKKYIKQELNYTAYSVNCYLRKSYDGIMEEVNLNLLSSTRLKCYFNSESQNQRGKKRKAQHLDDSEKCKVVLVDKSSFS